MLIELITEPLDPGVLPKARTGSRMWVGLRLDITAVPPGWTGGMEGGERGYSGISLINLSLHSLSVLAILSLGLF